MVLFQQGSGSGSGDVQIESTLELSPSFCSALQIPVKPVKYCSGIFLLNRGFEKKVPAMTQASFIITYMAMSIREGINELIS